jgi:hypothetical protein
VWVLQCERKPDTESFVVLKTYGASADMPNSKNEHAIPPEYAHELLDDLAQR